MGKHMTVIIHIKVEDQPVQGLKGVKSRSSIFHLERIFVFFLSVSTSTTSRSIRNGIRF